MALPLLRSVARRHGPVSLVHFDAHLDTWPTYFGARYTHGSMFRRAAEEGLFVPGHSAHVGIRGSLYAREDLDEDAGMGFRVFSCVDIDESGVPAIVERLREQIGDPGVPVDRHRRAGPGLRPGHRNAGDGRA